MQTGFLVVSNRPLAERMVETGGAPGKNAKVFISNSRKDHSFAEELLAGLEVGNFEPFLDRHDIAAGEAWEERLGNLIHSADVVVFVVSPHSVASERCGWEIDKAESLAKRLLPVVWRPLPESQAPKRLARLNW